MTDWIARRCLVAGRVQGVFYRASTRARAESLGVTGYARNLADGRVEVLACGEPQAVPSRRREMDRKHRELLQARIAELKSKIGTGRGAVNA